MIVLHHRYLSDFDYVQRSSCCVCCRCIPLSSAEFGPDLGNPTFFAHASFDHSCLSYSLLTMSSLPLYRPLLAGHAVSSLHPDSDVFLHEHRGFYEPKGGAGAGHSNLLSIRGELCSSGTCPSHEMVLLLISVRVCMFCTIYLFLSASCSLHLFSALARNACSLLFTLWSLLSACSLLPLPSRLTAEIGASFGGIAAGFLWTAQGGYFRCKQT
jgi:hypothetical protein